jgi:virginiamycin B lyase
MSFATPATPGAISQASSGPLWFVEPEAGLIVSAPNDESGELTQHDALVPPATLGATSADPATGGLWFTEPQSDGYGYMDPSGDYTLGFLPEGAHPSAISATGAGGAWVAAPGNRLVVLVERPGHERDVPVNGAPTAIAAVPGRQLAWVTEASASRVVLAGVGVEREYATPTSSSRPTEIVTDGGDGAWFVESTAGQLAHIDGSGHITEYPLPSGDGAVQGLAAGPGPDGSAGGAWFSEPANSRIGFISASGAVDEFTLPGAAPGELAVAATLNAPPLSGYDRSEAVWWTDAANGKIGVARFPLGTPAPAPASIFGAVSVKSARRVTVRRSMIALTLRCAGLVSCAGDATLRHQVRRPHAPPVMASLRFHIAAGRSAVLRLHLNGKGRGLVAAARRAGLSAGLTVRWSSYGHQVVRLMTLDPAPRRKAKLHR